MKDIDEMKYKSIKDIEKMRIESNERIKIYESNERIEIKKME
jgi:hypothetical protein